MDGPAQHDTRHLACVGLVGAGKTTVGRAVADRLGWGFVDVDEVIEQRTGCSVNELLDVGGEDAYWPLEREILTQVLAGDDRTVVATPGCVVVDASAISTIRGGQAVTVYLRARPETLARRLVADPRTGSMLDLHPEDALRSLFAARDHCYADLADHVVQVDDLDLAAVADAVLAAVPASLLRPA